MRVLLTLGASRPTSLQRADAASTPFPHRFPSFVDRKEILIPLSVPIVSTVRLGPTDFLQYSSMASSEEHIPVPGVSLVKKQDLECLSTIRTSHAKAKGEPWEAQTSL